MKSVNPPEKSQDGGGEPGGQTGGVEPPPDRHPHHALARPSKSPRCQTGVLSARQ